MSGNEPSYIIAGFDLELLDCVADEVEEGMSKCTSSGYKSEFEFRGMCSVNAKVCMPREMAV